MIIKEIKTEKCIVRIHDENIEDKNEIKNRIDRITKLVSNSYKTMKPKIK